MTSISLAEIPAPLATRAQANPATFAELTTIAVGGKFTQLIDATTEAELIDAVAQADADNIPVVVVGGGSNILANDADFSGWVVRDRRQDVTVHDVNACGGALVTATAGTYWDTFVQYAIENEWAGVEALSGIPGTVGAAPVQNIGAYGQDVSQVITTLRTWDRLTKKVRTLFLHDLQFGYRDSLLKKSMQDPAFRFSPRWVVLDVKFQLKLASLSQPISYQQLAQKLAVEIGQKVPASRVREAVLELRSSKGMVLNSADRDTYSLGSFFTNPVISASLAATLPENAPKYQMANPGTLSQIGAAAPQNADEVKTSAAWLIENAGFTPGYGRGENARLSTKHSLALTNRGQATASEIKALAEEIITGVQECFGVRLVPEPVFLSEV